MCSSRVVFSSGLRATTGEGGWGLSRTAGKAIDLGGFRGSGAAVEVGS